MITNDVKLVGGTRVKVTSITTNPDESTWKTVKLFDLNDIAEIVYDKYTNKDKEVSNTWLVSLKSGGHISIGNVETLEHIEKLYINRGNV